MGQADDGGRVKGGVEGAETKDLGQEAAVGKAVLRFGAGKILGELALGDMGDEADVGFGSWVGFGVGGDGADGVPREAMEGGLVQVGVCGWVGLGWVRWFGLG
jgi:hypothetical protein